MSAFAHDVTVGSTVAHNHLEFRIFGVQLDTTGNIHALGHRYDVRGDYDEYACFGTNGSKGADARIYANFITTDVNMAVYNYCTVSSLTSGLVAAAAVLGRELRV